MLETRDGGGLVGGKHLGQHLVNAELLRDGVGRPRIAAGDHRDAEALAVQRADGGARRLADRVRHGEHGGEAVVHGGVERRLAGVSQSLGLVGEGVDVETERGHEAVGTDGHAAAADGPAHAHPGDGLEASDGGHRQLTRLDGLGERARARALRVVAHRARSVDEPASATPSTPARAFSTRPTHAAHVMLST